MLSILSLPDAPVAFDTVVALGYFDGVHRGHMALLQETVRLARALGARPAVFTFSDGFKDKAPLTDPGERLRLFEAAGIEVAFLVDFAAVRPLSPEEFVKNCLQFLCRAKSAVCGFNFRFGKGAVGTAEDLLALFPEAAVVPAVYEGGEVISSTRVRRLLGEGRVEDAALLLGRPYTVTGEVLHGKELGAILGFPTANMKPKTLLPASAVYATAVKIDGKCFPAITDVGTRPTVEGQGELRMETHLPDFSGDLYGRSLSVAFLRRLREEKRFSSLEELKTQLEQDAASLRTLYATSRKDFTL